MAAQKTYTATQNIGLPKKVVRAGQPLPEGLDAKEVKRLVDAGLAKAGTAKAEEPEEPKEPEASKTGAEGNAGPAGPNEPPKE